MNVTWWHACDDKSHYEYRKRKMFEWMLHECSDKSHYRDR
jgi:hypothetical protein